MEDLDDKMTGGNLTADEWNQVPAEIQNVIEALGITLSAGDLNQLGKGIAGYVANGNFYVDSGVANAHVLSSIGSKQSPTAYTDGMEISFLPVALNTGAVTVNVGGLGVKNLRYSNGDVLDFGELATAKITTAKYLVSSGDFRLQNQKGSTDRPGELQMSDSDTETSTSLAATIASVTRRAKRAATDTISGLWTFTNNVIFSNDDAVQGKEVGGTVRDMVKMNTNDEVSVGNLNSPLVLASDGMIDILPLVGRNLFSVLPNAIGNIDGAATSGFLSNVGFLSMSHTVGTGIYLFNLNDGIPIADMAVFVSGAGVFGNMTITYRIISTTQVEIKTIAATTAAALDATRLTVSLTNLGL